MGAPIGNKFWELRSKHGVDKLFVTPQLMWEAACEYFEWCEDNPLLRKDWVGKDADQVEREFARPFTIQGLSLYLGVNTVYFNQFEMRLKDKEDELSKDFAKIVTRIRDTIYMQKFEGASAGFFNANIIARDLQLRDRSELSGPDGGAISVQQITGMVVR